MIKVGITEMHGIAQEYSQFPPEGVEYSPIETSDRITKRIFKSAAKGVYAYAYSPGNDILEAPLFPVITTQPWIYTPAHFSSAGSFDFFGMPTPRFMKMYFAKGLLLRENFKKLIFKSEFGRNSLYEYGGIKSNILLDKTSVVHPVVRRIPDESIVYQNVNINLLFVGEFLRKGGANVVDAFIRLDKEYDGLTLTICSSSKFQTSNDDLKKRYLKKIDNHNNIEMIFVNRDVLFTEILPKADIYLCPTYREAWGFSIQEAMAFGIPVVATNISAIPEIIEDGVSGVLLDIKNHPYIRNMHGYVVGDIPDEFSNYLTEQVYLQTKRLIDDLGYRKTLGMGGLEVARTKFSIERRNELMSDIYRQALN